MKNLCLIFVFIFALPFFCFGCEKQQENLNQYLITASFDDATKSLSCQQKVVWNNNSQDLISQISFFLYANAFEEGQTPMPTYLKNKSYPHGESFGRIEIFSAYVNGESANFALKNEKINILVVDLEDSLACGESVCIELEYCVWLANINHRLGYGENTINFGNFYPIVCVYDKAFIENDFATNGDPFYSEVANYEVTVCYEQSFEIAYTGEEVKTKIENGCKTSKFVANRVRDFCFVLSKEFDVLSETSDGVVIKYFSYDDQNSKHHLQTAVNALETFSNMFGDYPYKTFCVVKSNFCFGGMEYPNLVLIADDITDTLTFDYVIVHEAAHQWWYGIVGNNEFSEAWLDESLTEYSTALFFEKHKEYGFSYDGIIDNANKTYQKFVEVYSNILGEVNESMLRNLNEFATEPEYVNCIYTKGVLLYDDLRKNVGDKNFFHCLKDYFKQYKYQNSSTKKLIECFSLSCCRNLENFFNKWLMNNKN